MNDFTKNISQALFNQDKINDLLRHEIQQAVNDLLESELTAFLGYDPYAGNGWNTGNSRNVRISVKLIPSLDQLRYKCHEIAMVCFINTLCQTINNILIS